ncbi:helix-turn-helix domain-containing protein [Bacteroides sp.]|uniref:helix-turn-helix domain-containing protein n=1 Tax=Bacteroides sp. TaxID=29523 RepID=UPI0025BE7203|nr:helix-turn-helix transcriptional regulator [Bacteroides sp.]
MLYNLALLFPCAVCLFGAMWLLCKRESNTKAQNILMLCLLLSSVFFFCTANYIAGIPDYITYRRLDILDCLVTPFIIPTMYLYFRALTYEGTFTWKDYIWFLPSLVVGIGTYILYQAMDETQAANYITTVLINKSPISECHRPIYQLHYLFSIKLYTSIALVQIIGTATCAIFYLRHYHHRLQEFHSTLDDKSITLDYTILFWFISVIPFAFGIILIDESFWQQNPAITSFYFIGYTTAYFGVFYYGSQRKYTVENLAEDLEQADIEAIRNNYDSIDNIANTSKYTRHLTIFNKLIEEELVFLQSNLRADELAAKMHTNRTYLSQMFKEEFHCTFSDYINHKRIDYSQQLMLKNPTIKQIDLAEQSGFSSINSFGRTFKQITGIPPKEWLKNNIDKS